MRHFRDYIDFSLKNGDRNIELRRVIVFRYGKVQILSFLSFVIYVIFYMYSLSENNYLSGKNTS